MGDSSPLKASPLFSLPMCIFSGVYLNPLRKILNVQGDNGVLGHLLSSEDICAQTIAEAGGFHRS